MSSELHVIHNSDTGYNEMGENVFKSCSYGSCIVEKNRKNLGTMDLLTFEKVLKMKTIEYPK